MTVIRLRYNSHVSVSLLPPKFIPMKRKAEPASVEEEDEDPKTGEVFLKAGERASITSSSDQFERRSKWRKSDLDFRRGSASKYLGSILDVIGQAKEAKEGEMFTILAGEHEDNQNVWKECEKLGRKYRAFYLAGKRLRYPFQGSGTDLSFQTRS